MTAKHDGGSAFPGEKFIAYPHGGGYSHRDGGMSLRDYFAAKAMQGLISSERSLKALNNAAYKNRLPLERVIAFGAYEMADAMLKAREST